MIARERRVAGLSAVPVPPGAAGASRAGLHRSGSAPRFLVRHAVRALGTGNPGVGAPRTANRAVGVLAGRLPGLLGLQTVPHHGWDVTSLYSQRRIPASAPTTSPPQDERFVQASLLLVLRLQLHAELHQ